MSADIDYDFLTPEEYYCSGSEGYLRFHIDINKFMEMLLSDKALAELIDAIFGGNGNAVENLKSLTGYRARRRCSFTDDVRRQLCSRLHGLP